MSNVKKIGQNSENNFYTSFARFKRQINQFGEHDHELGRTISSRSLTIPGISHTVHGFLVAFKWLNECSIVCVVNLGKFSANDHQNFIIYTENFQSNL